LGKIKYDRFLTCHRVYLTGWKPVLLKPSNITPLNIIGGNYLQN
jgi:hypothetical protein